MDAGQAVGVKGGKFVQGWEAALWRTLTKHWLDPNTAIPTHVLDWLVHATPPARHGIDIAWTPHPHTP